jgi:AcrR family transcriptional regulator
MSKEKTGLRDRKKEMTRRAVQKVAMNLFARQGYAATSVEQIAGAADISPATFYRYYQDKEDVVFSLDYSSFIEKVVSARPDSESLAATIQALLKQLGEWFEADRDLYLTRYDLMKSIPALRARRGLLRQDALDKLAQLIAPRLDLTPDNYELRLSLAIGLAAEAETTSHWAEKKGVDSLPLLFEQVFQQIKPMLRVAPQASKATPTAHQRSVKRPK